MSKKIYSLLLTTFFCAFAPLAQTQETGKIHRIGFLSSGVPGFSPDIEAFQQGLRDLGYVEGKNLVIEYRYTERNPIGTLTSFQTLSASKLMSSSGMGLRRPLLQRKQPAQYPSL